MKGAAPRCEIGGSLAKVCSAAAGPVPLIAEYLRFPEVFAAQFAAPVDSVHEVLARHTAAWNSGLASYFEVFAKDAPAGSQALAHLRAEWRLATPGEVGVHGGSAQPNPPLPAVRHQAWALLNAAILQLDGVCALATCCLVSNQRAQRFIESTGYLRLRRMRTPGGATDTWHFGATRRELAGNAAFRQAMAGMTLTGDLDQLRRWRNDLCDGIPADSSGSQSLPPPSGLGAPSGWCDLSHVSPAPWIAWIVAHPDRAEAFAGEPIAATTTAADLAAGLRLNLGYGFSYFGLIDGETVTGLVTVQRYPADTRWWRLQGGPTAAATAPLAQTVRQWLSQCAADGLIHRVELLLPSGEQALAEFWQAVGFVHEGPVSASPLCSTQVWSLLACDVAPGVG